MSMDLWLAFAAGMIFAILLWLHLHSSAGAQEELSSQAVLQEGNNESLQGVKKQDFSVIESDQVNPDGLTLDEEDSQSRINIRVYLTENKRVEQVPLETYVAGVVAAEMTTDFEPAALQAQALAARTYIIRRLWLNDESGMDVPGADVTDTQTHQVYRSLSQMKQLAQTNEEGWQKIRDAVSITAGQVITYEHEPIEALFFSTSNGYTENSEEVFASKLPYLRSVASPWDQELSPRAKETVEMPLSEFYHKLGVDSFAAGAGVREASAIRVLERTEGHRVKRLAVGGHVFTGTEVREKLGLRSASFQWLVRKDEMILTVFGSGHGVGMSQWGAQGMAKAGLSARQIVEHYYPGTGIEKVSNLLNSNGKRL